MSNSRPPLEFDEPVAAVLLAGGRSRRMGGADKMLLELGGTTLLERVIARVGPQAAALLLSVNGEPARFRRFGLPLRADTVGERAGPLAGILTGLEWLRETRPDIRWLASVATDTPFLPADLVGRLKAAVAAGGADLACAASGGRLHPVFGLWPVDMAGALRRALVEEGLHKVALWTARYRLAQVEWPGGEDDPFFNVNTPGDLEELRRRLESGSI